MKNIFKKHEKIEGEEAIELTPEEKKEKVKKTVSGVLKTVGAMAAGAALTVAALAGFGAKTANESSEDCESSAEISCDEASSDPNPEE